MVSDDDMKEKLRKMLEDDSTYAEKLTELTKKGISYDKLWNDMLYSELLAQNRIKKGYYIRRVKDALWATFRIHGIMPFDESFTREQMNSWKTSSLTRSAYDKLYNQIKPGDDNVSDSYLSSIVKKVFVSDEEQRKKNALWCQAVLEIIFDKSYLISKIESDTIDKWYTNLQNVDGDQSGDNDDERESEDEA